MLGGIVPYPPRRRKHAHRRVYAKQVKIAERAKVDVSILVDGGCKADGPRRNGGVKVALQLPGAKAGCFYC